MASSTVTAAIPCPLCEYDLAALPGTPDRAGAVFTADVTCPECGTAVPAGGRVIEGALHPQSLRPNSRAMIVVLVVNAAAFILISTQLIFRTFRGGAAAGPNASPWMLIQAAAMGMVVVTFGWEVWRRSRFARGSASAFLAGREIRWIVAPTGLECIDRSKPLKQPKRTRVEAARMYCVTGTAGNSEPAASTASSAWSVSKRAEARDTTTGDEVKRPVTRLVAWAWTLDANGRRVDIEPLAIFTLDAKADPVAADPPSPATPEAIAKGLERILGLPADAESRPLPWSPLSDTRTWMRYFQIVMISAMFVTVVGMIALPREWSYLWVLGTVVVTAATFQVTRMAMKAVRRRWVRVRP